MAVHASSPLPIVFVSPPDAGDPAPHGLMSGGRIQSGLLCAEVAACVAAVGHRLHVVPRSSGWTEAALAAAGEPPALVVWGLGAAEAVPQEVSQHLQPGLWPDVPVIPVALVGAAGPSGALSLPEDSRQLCHALARADPAGAVATDRGQAVVLAHQGAGPDGDARWPGLSWALTLLWGGPGRGLLVDARGPGGGLSARLRDLAPPGTDCIGWQSAGEVPVPGPALAARLPGAGGVRWWGWSPPVDPPAPGVPLAPGEPPEAGATLWTEWEACVQSAREAFAWTVVDVGRDLDRARAAADDGAPVVLCTDRPRAADPLGRSIDPDVLLQASDPPPDPPAGSPRDARLVPHSGQKPHSGPAPHPVPFRASDWAGTSWAAWRRSARRGPGRQLAAAVALRLEQRAGTGPGGVLTGRISP